MSIGASDIDKDNNPLVRALATDFLWTTKTITYGFQADNQLYLDAWGRYNFSAEFTVAEKMWLRDAFKKISAVVDLNFREVPFAQAALDLIKEEDIGGGIRGYAFFPRGNTSRVVLDEDSISDSVVPIHEIGHALGLDHPFSGIRLPGVFNSSSNGENLVNNNLYTVMAYNPPRLNEKPGLGLPETSNLGALDIAALQAMYGANQTYRTGDNTYTRPNEILSIWDAGGTDKIDFSAETAPSVINLNAATLEREAGGAGSASYVEVPGTTVLHGVYTIPYGVVIENAYGGSGNDTITGNAASNFLYGGAGDDRLFGNDGNDRIRGDEGNDFLSGGGDDDLVSGGTGNDKLYGSVGNDILIGGAGADVLSGGPGRDRAQYSNASAGVAVDLQLLSNNIGDAAGDSYNSVEDLFGSQFNDRLIGDQEDNILWGDGGDDVLYGRLGNDDLRGGKGSDRVFGGVGDDLIRGGSENDYLSGGGDSDLIRGQSGDDELYGNDGNDFLLGDDGADILSGGLGFDRAQYSTASVGVVADLQVVSNNTGDAAGDSYNSIEGLCGSKFSDRLSGDQGDNILWGYAGDDLLSGRSGNDELRGGNGYDRLVGGLGDDILRGDGGQDTFVFADQHGSDVVVDFKDGEDQFLFLRTGLAFEDLVITDGQNDVTVDYGTGNIRIVGTDLDLITTDDFFFL